MRVCLKSSVRFEVAGRQAIAAATGEPNCGVVGKSGEAGPYSPRAGGFRIGERGDCFALTD